VNAATYGLAEAYLEKGQYAKSVELYERLVKDQPQNLELQEALARARNALTEKNSKQ
jgi:predicted Zn-dependent protease